MLETILGGIVLVFVTIVAAFLKGRQSQRTEEEAKELDAYVQTRKELDHVAPFDTATDAAEWLRNRGK